MTRHQHHLRREAGETRAQILQELKTAGATGAALDRIQCIFDKLTDAEIQLRFRQRAHGHLCTAMIHLYHAVDYLGHSDAVEAAHFTSSLAAELAEIIPSYPDFTASTYRRTR